MRFMKKINIWLLLLFVHLNIYATNNPDFLIMNELSRKVQGLPTDSAIVIYKKAFLQYIKISGKEEIQIELLSKLGSLYRLNADFTSAFNVDMLAYRKAEKLNHDRYLALTNQNLGIDYYRTDKLDLANKHYLKSLNYYRKLNDSTGMANCFCKLAMIFEDRKNFIDAGKYYKLALNVFTKLDDCVGLSDVYNGLASYYYFQYKPDSTEFYALKALEMYERCGSKETISFMNINLASLKNYTKDHKKALEYLDKGMMIAKELHLMSQLRQGYKSLSETYSYMGDYENAYKYALIYGKYKDSIFNSEKEKIFQELETKYQTEKKELLINEKQKEIEFKNELITQSKIQRIFLIVVIGLVLIFLLFIIYRYYEKKKSSKLLDLKNKQLADLISARDKLFSIISHDLSSPVASFTRLTGALEKSFDKLEKQQLKDYVSEMKKTSAGIQLLLSNLLQWSIKQSGHFVPEPEPCILKNLIEETVEPLNESAILKQINLKVEVDGNIQIVTDRKMFETILRNLLSNAIKYSPSERTVFIKAKPEDDLIKVMVMDEGEGLDDEDIEKLFKVGEDNLKIGKNQKNKGTGLGLVLCKEFAQLLGGSIEVTKNQPSGLIFTLFLPLK